MLLPDSLDAPIEHVSVGDARETLGLFMCPPGEAKRQITSMQNKSQERIDRAKECNTRQRDVWFLMDHQLWPKIWYGLCSLSAPWKQLDGCLRQK